MQYNRRQSDKCIAKRLYETATPYVQVIGWIAVAVPALYAAFSFYFTAQADHAVAQDYLEFKPSIQQSLAVLTQKVDDMHTWMKADRNKK